MCKSTIDFHACLHVGLEENEPIFDVTITVDESTSAPSGDTVTTAPETTDEQTIVGSPKDTEVTPSAVITTDAKTPSSRKVSPTKVAPQRPSTTKVPKDKPKPKQIQAKPALSSKKTGKSKTDTKGTYLSLLTGKTYQRIDNLRKDTFNLSTSIDN